MVSATEAEFTSQQANVHVRHDLAIFKHLKGGRMIR